MKTPVFCCHARLTEMSLERNGSRYRPAAILSIDADCPWCKQMRSLFNMRDYQRKRHLQVARKPKRKPKLPRLTPPEILSRVKEWPEGLRFDE